MTTALEPKDTELGPLVIGQEQWEANQRALKQQGKNPSGAGPQVIMTPQEWDGWVAEKKPQPWTHWLDVKRGIVKPDLELLAANGVTVVTLAEEDFDDEEPPIIRRKKRKTRKDAGLPKKRAVYTAPEADPA